MPTGTIRLERRGGVAVLTTDNPDRHNAFDDDLDDLLAAALDEIAADRDVRAVVWRGEGPSFSSGRDVGAIARPRAEGGHHELMQRVHALALRVLDLPVPMIVALHGWVMGVSFQRALLADVRIATPDTRFRLPEVTHGYIPDAGGVARLHQICGPGVASDLVLTGRTMDAAEALGHGIVSRLVDPADLDAEALTMAERVAAAPLVTVRMARRVLTHLARPTVAASLDEELLAQTVVATSPEHAAWRRARREDVRAGGARP